MGAHPHRRDRACFSCCHRAQGVKTSELSARDREDADNHTWLFERIEDGPDEFLLLNAFGHFLRSDPHYRAIIGTRICATKRVHDACLDGSRRAMVADQLTELLRQLAAPRDNVGTLHHEVTFGHRDPAWALFKGTSGKQGVFRAAYRWNASEDTLSISQAWFDHQAYELAAGNRSVFEEPKEQLQDVTGLLYS